MHDVAGVFSHKRTSKKFCAILRVNNEMRICGFWGKNGF